MNHIRRIDEFNSYTDDAARNVPQELLNTGEESNFDLGAEMSVLPQKLKTAVKSIVEVSLNGEEDLLDDLCLSLNEEEARIVANLIERIGDRLADKFRNMANRN